MRLKLEGDMGSSMIMEVALRDAADARELTAFISSWFALDAIRDPRQPQASATPTAAPAPEEQAGDPTPSPGTACAPEEDGEPHLAAVLCPSAPPGAGAPIPEPDDPPAQEQPAPVCDAPSPGAGAPMTGEDLRKARDVLGMTQSDLAHVFGIRQNTVSKIETGKLYPVPDPIAEFIRSRLRAKGRA